MRKWIAVFSVQTLVVIAISMEVSLARAQPNSSVFQTVWVWPNPDGTPVSDVNAGKALVANAHASGVTSLFVSVYQPTKNSSGRYMFDDQILADLIQQSHENGIQVWAAYGNPDWINYACSDGEFPVDRMSEVLNYNKAKPSAKIDGVVLDVEPPSAITQPTATPTVRKRADSPSAGDLLRLLALYRCLIEKSSPLPVSAAISPYWDTPLAPPREHFYQQAITLHLDHVIVMGYRNFVGSNDCSQQGIACLDWPAINYWETCGSIAIGGCEQGRSGNILAGLETGNIEDTAGDVTFFNKGQTALDQAATDTINTFSNGGLGGFAIHAYQNAYLSSASSNWPSTNPGFPKSIALKTHSRQTIVAPSRGQIE